MFKTNYAYSVTSRGARRPCARVVCTFTGKCAHKLCVIICSRNLNGARDGGRIHVFLITTQAV